MIYNEENFLLLNGTYIPITDTNEIIELKYHAFVESILDFVFYTDGTTTYLVPDIGKYMYELLKSDELFKIASTYEHKLSTP